MIELSANHLALPRSVTPCPVGKPKAAPSATSAPRASRFNQSMKQAKRNLVRKILVPIGTDSLPGNGDTAMVHHPHYVFSDSILAVSAAYWITLTEQYLGAD